MNEILLQQHVAITRRFSNFLRVSHGFANSFLFCVHYHWLIKKFPIAARGTEQEVMEIQTGMFVMIVEHCAISAVRFLKKYSQEYKFIKNFFSCQFGGWFLYTYHIHHFILSIGSSWILLGHCIVSLGPTVRLRHKTSRR